MSKKLRGEFTFGFEFEGFGRLETYLQGTDAYNHYDEDFDYMECNSLDGDDYNDYYESINHFINRCLGAKNGRTHYDGSVKNYHDGYQSFEYSSTIYKVNAKNFKKLNNFFSKLSNYDMGINETCGFHTHISYNGITEKDAVWIVAQIACNEDWTKEVTQMVDGDNIIDFFNQRYADKEFLLKIRNNILQGNYNIRNLFNSDKYRVLRIHPLGTIEWRGPRNFLNLENGFMKFTKKLTKVVDIFSKALEMNTIPCTGISKNTFFKLLNNNLNGEQLRYNCCSIDINKCKTFSRNGIVGLATDFNINNVSSKCNLLNYNVIHKISANSLNNPNILFDENVDLFFDAIFPNLSSETSRKYIITANSKNIKLDKTRISNILLKHSEILPLIVNYFDSFSLEELMFYIDRIDFNCITDKTKKDIVDMCINQSKKENVIDIMNALLLADFTTFKYILDIIKSGFIKDLDCTRLYNIYKKKYSEYNMLQPESVFKPLKDENLIKYDENCDNFILNLNNISSLLQSIEITPISNITIDTTTNYYDRCEDICEDRPNEYRLYVERSD